MNVTHTPLPWHDLYGQYVIPVSHINRRIGGSTNKQHDRDEFAHVICKIERNSNRFSADEASANAALIVKAVNAHDSLLASLKALYGVLDAFGDMPDGLIAPSAWKGYQAEEKLEAARAALAAAGEQV